MHELTLSRSILEIVMERASQIRHAKIKKIQLEIGQLAAVDASALRFGFEALAKGTVAEHAMLEIITVEGQATCDTCHKTVKLTHYFDACEDCGCFTLTVTQGEELRVMAMEVA